VEIVMPFLLITTFWGASIGSRNGNRFWLYSSTEGFASSLWAALGFWISFGGGFMTLIGLLIFFGAATVLFQVTKEQFYNGFNFEMWVLYFGKLSFSIMTAGLLFLVAMLFGMRGK